MGEDQKQHVELARALARRFNSAYGEVFTVARAVLPPTGARVRDLTDPTRKMSKSARDAAGVVFVLDDRRRSVPGSPTCWRSWPAAGAAVRRIWPASSRRTAR